MKLPGATIREMFIQFFAEKHGHLHVPSASLIPSNPTVLLTPAGMLPFVPVFLGIEPPPTPPRAVSAQKCARVSGKASDLAFVGRTPRHHTFFEMLGNFSFGDYFKPDAIAWAWELITTVYEIPVARLWVTVHHTDDEARGLWRDAVGVAENRIISRGDKDNFWGPPGPTGPCGPCTEIFYDRGEQYACGPDCSLEKCDCDRYVEIWNLVFMQLFQDDKGQRTPLEKKNVDTGMGLERIATVLQGVDNTFETDLLFPILQKVADLTGHRYHESPETDVALKIVTDHLRCVTFAIADGITPSNDGRGYVIRMILRRGIRFAKKLGLSEPMLYKMVATIRDMYQDTYPELKAQYGHIVETVKAEEKRFLETLERGSRMLDDLIATHKAAGKAVVPGEDVFKLYDTYGFPMELTAEIVEEQGLTVDEPGFEAAMTGQREKARAAQGDKTIVSGQAYADILREHGPTHFTGYDALDGEGTIVALIHDGQLVPQFGGTNQPFELVLDVTPFYGESGGQVGDRGILFTDSGQLGQTVVVKDTRKVGELFVHQCLFDQGGRIEVGQTVTAEVNAEARARAAQHHSATHLLHAALKRILGDSVQQAGSYVGPDGGRFDFTFPRGMKPEEVQQAEMTVNRWILENLERDITVTDVESAKQAGAVAMFNEKYGNKVRMISFGPHSRELCGGTHVERLGDIGLFKITSEGAIAAGVRRLEYVAGELALYQMMRVETEMTQTASLLKVPMHEVGARITKLLDERKQLEQSLKRAQEKLALAQVHQILAERLGGIIVRQVDAQDSDTVRFLAETLSRQAKEDAIVLGAAIDGKASFVAAIPPNWVEKGLKAGDLVKQAAVICGGGGGGKPNFAQAGGKDGSQVAQALAEVSRSLEALAQGHPASAT